MDIKSGIFSLIVFLAGLFFGYSYFESKSLNKNNEINVYKNNLEQTKNEDVNKIGNYLSDDVPLYEIYQPGSIIVEHVNKTPAWYKSLSADYPIGNVPGKDLVKNYLDSQLNSLACLNDEPDSLSEEEVDKLEYGREMYLCGWDFSYSNTASKNFLTHDIGNYLYAGGAHGIYGDNTITVDRFGKEYMLKDLIKEDYKGDYLSDILEKIKIAFSHQPGFESGWIDPYVFSLENMKTIPFEMTREGIVFIFGEAQGVSHAGAPITITLPYGELNGIIKEEVI